VAPPHLARNARIRLLELECGIARKNADFAFSRDALGAPCPGPPDQLPAYRGPSEFQLAMAASVCVELGPQRVAFFSCIVSISPCALRRAEFTEA